MRPDCRAAGVYVKKEGAQNAPERHNGQLSLELTVVPFGMGYGFSSRSRIWWMFFFPKEMVSSSITRQGTLMT